ncbi:MAG: hypothetical protein QHI38_00835 [Armatimonadota bacterium]|nr:hypothetical protein [Armatimonadota bacterium]
MLFSSSCLGETVRVTGYIGSHKVVYEAEAVYKEAEFKLAGTGDYVAVTEVYPDTPERLIYRYRISGSGVGSYERCSTSLGFGPVTYFLRVRGAPVGTIKITNHSTNGSKSKPVLIRSIKLVKRSALEDLLAWDRFTIMGLIPDGSPDQREQWLELLVRNVVGKPEYHINTGFSSEIYYANRDSTDVRRQIQQCADWSKKYRVPALLGLVSWWAGTPIWVDDGQGSKFGDIKYQQICYSPDDEGDYNRQLAVLLGDRYNRHYGLSVPNQWSNCPWLTMNSEVLNNYRYARLDQALAHLKSITGDSCSWIKGIYLENEPRYWDSDCEAGNPNSNRKTLWADFNPLTVAAAARDGVDLNPADGLSTEELAWLHRNVGRYVQNTVDAARNSLKKHRFRQDVPIYTHTLQLRNLFPGRSIHHPASEWGYANGARTGLEGMWSQPSDFYRVREWGPWCNLNREENDGRHIDLHLWDLRVAYALGADLYNSYNWHQIGAERFFGYVREFIENLPVVTLPPAECRWSDRTTLRLKTPMKLQAFSRFDVQVKVNRKIAGCAFLSIALGSGERVCSQQQPIKLDPGLRTLTIDFSTPVEIPYTDEATVVMYVFDSRGRSALDAVEFVPASAGSVRLSLDMRTQRALSLYAIKHASRGVEEK